MMSWMNWQLGPIKQINQFYETYFIQTAKHELLVCKYKRTKIKNG